MTNPPPLHIVHPVYPPTGEGATAALMLLGTTAEQVAHTLACRDCLGEPGESCNCPIAVYLHRMLRPTCEVAVGETTVIVFAPDGAIHEVDLPGPVRRFVAAFDLGAYPFLRPDFDPEQEGR